MKALKFPIIPLLMGLITLVTYAQGPVPAGFELEGDLYTSSRTTADDWFTGKGGPGVLSLDSLAIFQDRITNRNNVPFYSGMSVPDMTVMDGRIWYTANFGHDPLATDADANPKAPDSSRFSSFTFSEDPRDWTVVAGYLEPWVDLTDSYVHFRRDGTNTSDSLYIVGGLGALSTKKGRFLDMELYATDLDIQGSSFVNTGEEGGHTAWQFDASGKVLVAGDLDLGFAKENGHVIRTEIYLWVSREDYQNNRGFTYYSFRPAFNDAPFGYALIATDPAMVLQPNTSPTAAPPWGTHNRKLRVESDYKNRQFFEFALNLTALGLDPANNAVDTELCGLPWQKMLIKSRKTTEVGAFLEDFAGPYPLFDNAAPEAPEGLIEDPGNFDSCASNQTLMLQAVHRDSSYIYTWRSLDPGLTFEDGSQRMSGQGLFEVGIGTPGSYELSIQPATYCGTPGITGTVTVRAAPCAVPDDVEVDYESPTVILPAANDFDLENDIDPQSVNTTGLQGPSFGTVSIAGTGEITYTPDPGYSGPDSFEYRICDENNLCATAVVTVRVNSTDPPPGVDSDGDGVMDSQDLDDDNDGIPDVLEMQAFASGEQPDCSGEFALDFSNPAILESGTDKTVGAIYRIADINTGVDALISVTDIHNATINAIDRNNEAPHAFRPSTSFDFSSDGEQAMVEYTIRFVQKDSYEPVVLGVLFMNFNDIDGTPNYGEQSWAFNPMSFVLSDPTELTMEGEGQWLIGTSGTTDYDGATNQNPQVNFGISFSSRSEVKVRVGVISRMDGNQSTSRQHSIEFQCVTNYINPMHVSLDSDFDGIANHLDLDSDNDGIYDAWEAGHQQSSDQGILVGNYGANGLADAVEETADSGSLNYTLRDTSASGIPDFLETDSDADGCSDANEAYSDPNRDGADNEFYGTGSPPPVDANGLLRNAPYSEPADANNNGEADHLESPAALLLQNPSDQSSCPGEEVLFQTSVASVAEVYWEEEIDGVWQEIPESDRIQGRHSPALQLVDVQASDHGRRFRLVLTAPGQVCEQYSEPALLRVGSVPSVQAQASSTTITSGEWVTLTGSGATFYNWDNGITDGEAVQLFRTTTFTVTGYEQDGCPASDEVTVEVITMVDLSLTLESDRNQPNVGDPVNLSLTLQNDGPNRASGIQVVMIIPDGISIQTMGPGATLNGNLLRWEVERLDTESVTLPITATLRVPEGVLNEYRLLAQVVRCDQDDRDSTPGNLEDRPREDDEAVLEFGIPQSELEVLKSVSETTVAVGDLVEFEVGVSNQGPYAATGLQIEELLPSGYTIRNSETDLGVYDPVAGLWEIDTLAVGMSAFLRIQAEVNGEGEYLNTATLRYAQQWEQDTTNNTSSAGVSRVHRIADLSLTKSTDAQFPNVGDVITFRLELSNAGPDHATDVVIQDVVPPGFTIVAVQQDGVIDGNVISWHIDDLPPGTMEFTYDLRVNAPTGEAGEYRNIAVIAASTQEDPDSEPGEDQEGTEDDEAVWEVNPPTGSLYIEKTVSQEEAAVGESVQFTIAATNTGSYALTNLFLQDQLPSGYELLEFTLTHGQYNPADGLWEIPVLDLGETAILTMEVLVTDSDDYLNTVSLYQVDQWIPQPEEFWDDAHITPKEDCLQVYNEFSPNQDGKNEVLWIDCIESYPNNHLQIFDRWGNKVYEAHGYNNSWTGDNHHPTAGNKENELPVGTYYYILKLGVADLPDKTGWIYISR